MIVRYFETAWRMWWVWILAMLLPLGTAYVLLGVQPTQYDTQTTIWVEQSNYLDLPNASNAWTTPAQTQAEVFRQLVSTRAFLSKIVEGTSLEPFAADEKGRDYLEEQFLRRLKVTTRGTQLVEITYRTDDPQLGVTVLNSLIKVATAYITASTQEQARIAQQFYSAQLPQRERELLDATSALREYATKNTPLPGERPIGDRLLEQIELGDLRRREELARKRYEDTVNNLDRVKIQAGAIETFQKRGFRIVDQPFAPTRPASLRRELLLPLGVAVAVGGLLSLGLTLFMTWTDRSLTRDRVASATGLSSLGSIPSYRRYRRRADPRRVTAQALTLRPAAAGD